jgi:hypothetical protein
VIIVRRNFSRGVGGAFISILRVQYRKGTVSWWKSFDIMERLYRVSLSYTKLRTFKSNYSGGSGRTA